MFPDIEAKDSVKLRDVIDIFDKMRNRSLDLEDNDAVRYASCKRKMRHDDKREKGEEIRYTMTGFVWVFMIWPLEVIPATHVCVGK
ncbi:hypothetical protein Tco_1242514 [Tanacetum coccineum]